MADSVKEKSNQKMMLETYLRLSRNRRDQQKDVDLVYVPENTDNK